MNMRIDARREREEKPKTEKSRKPMELSVRNKGMLRRN
jgi:hypothetical protein